MSTNTYPQPELKTQHKGAIAYMAHHSVASNLLMVILMLAGCMMGFLIKQEVFPTFDIDQVQILVPYPGASPEEIELGIVQPIEEALLDIDGIDEVIAKAKENVANVSVKAATGTDVNKLSRDIQSSIDRISTFPSDAEKPIVQVMSMHRRGLNIALYGPASMTSLQMLAEKLKDQLIDHPSISNVSLDGIKAKEITIEVDEFKMRKHSITFSQLTQIVAQASGDTPSGSIKEQQGEFLLRVKHRRDHAEDFAHLPIPNHGYPLFLKDIATIKDHYEESDYRIRWNGQNCILIDINMSGNEGPVQISKAAREVVESFMPQLPDPISISTLYDDSNAFKDRMNLLMRNASLGLCLVFIMLSILLRARLAFWVTMGIPISFLSALLFLPALDVSINMVSLFAFIIALGIVVDDAVIVGENIFEWRQKGYSAIDASILGAKEVAIPVTFSILTNIAAFMPLAFVPGMMGKIFRLIPAVVILIFLASWVESLFILPSHLAHGKMNQQSRSPLRHISSAFENIVKKLFSPVVSTVVHYRYVALFLSCCTLFVIVVLIKSGIMGFTLFPKVESDRVVVNFSYPFGTPVEQTQQTLDRLRTKAQMVLDEWPEKNIGKGIIETVSPKSAGSHVAEMQVILIDPEERNTTVSQIMETWREKVGPIPGLQSIMYQADKGGPGSGPALSFQIKGSQLSELKMVNDAVLEFLQGYPMVKDIEDGFAEGKPQYDFTLSPSALALGLNAQDLSRELRSRYNGGEAIRQLRGRNEVKVKIKLNDDARQSLNHLENSIMTVPGKGEIPLKEATHKSLNKASMEITRTNGSRTITINANVSPRKHSGLIKEEMQSQLIPELSQRFPSVKFSFEGRQKDMIDSMKVLGLGFLLALVVIYVLLAIPFNSYLQPLIIMISIPFGIVGAVLGHLVMGYSLSVMSMFGIVALSGVVVNDSLVLIDLANRKHRDGLSPFEAITQAATRRFRPIFLTSVTTFFGLAPMILETSPQARFLIPMAISLGFGIIFATVIALLITPCLYMFFNDLQKLSSTEPTVAS